MKMIKNATTALVSIAAVVAMTACSSDSDTPISGKLATGGFTKSIGIPGAGMIGDFHSAIPKIRIQYMYEASEMDGSGNITEIKLPYSLDTTADITCSEVTIKMGHTTLADMTTPLANNVEQGAGTLETVLATSTIIFPVGATGDRYTFALDTPFHYNGVDNLVVDIDRNGTCDGDFPDKSTSTIAVTTAWTVDDDTTSTQSTWHADMDFTFEGGDNTIDYAGTSGNSWPFSTSLPRVQMLYTSETVNGSGPLTGVAFQVGSTTVEATYSAMVKMGHTTLSQFTDGDLFADSYSAKPTVMENNVTFTVPAGLVQGDWFWVPLNGDFKYNGTDNLIVDINVTAATASTILNRINSISDVRLSAVDGAVTGADTTAYDAKLRFNGAPMSVVEGSVMAYTIPFNSAGQGGQFIYGSHVLGTAAKLDSISFRVAADVAADATFTDVNITIGHTTLSDLTTTLADNMDEATAVFRGDITVPAGTKAGDWITVPTTRFTYDPTKNLTIQIDPVSTSFDLVLYYGGNGVVSNSASFTAGSTTTLGFEGTRHPQLQLGFTK